MCDDEGTEKKKPKLKRSEKLKSKENVFESDDDVKCLPPTEPIGYDNQKKSSAKGKFSSVEASDGSPSDSSVPQPSEIVNPVVAGSDEQLKERLAMLKSDEISQGVTAMKLASLNDRFDPLNPPKTCSVCGPPLPAWIKTIGLPIGTRHAQMLKAYSATLGMWAGVGVLVILYGITNNVTVRGCTVQRD